MDHKGTWKACSLQSLNTQAIMARAALLASPSRQMCLPDVNTASFRQKLDIECEDTWIP